nr:GAF domain-containing protein [Pseudoduganella dura]
MARILGVATSTVQAWMENGLIVSWKTPGGHRRTRFDEIGHLLQLAPLPDEARYAVAGEMSTSTIPAAEFLAKAHPGYPVSRSEQDRLKALYGSGLVDTAAEQRFDRIVRLASLATGSPIALISLLTSTRQWFKARVGLDAQETPREWAFCSHTVLGTEPFIVEDAASDPRFFTNPLVQNEPRIRFYAGVPVSGKTGHVLGTLCVIDREPRKLRSSELHALLDLAHIASEELGKSS